jgi:hypothetical protein
MLGDFLKVNLMILNSFIIYWQKKLERQHFIKKVYLRLTDRIICLALCLRLLLGDIDLVYPVMSMMVIGPSLPILRQRRWSLMCDVFDST